MSTHKTAFRAGGRERELSQAIKLDQLGFSGTYTLLADFSEFEPNIADAVYLAWSKAGVIRAAYGDQHDDKAWYGGQRRALLHQGGIKFLGIYQYLVAGQDGAAQADAMHRLVGALEPGEVLIADFEEATAAENQAGTHKVLTAWYNRMLALGYPAKYLWTYAGLYFGQAHGVLPVQWLADYTFSEPSSPHTLWQFTSSFPIPGVGIGDCSVYRGTVDQLAAQAYQAPAPPGTWTFGPVRDLNVTVGRTSIRVDFNSPSVFLGNPPTNRPGVDQYEIAVSPGNVLSSSNSVDSYPRYLQKSTTSSSESWQVGGFASGKTYIGGIRAQQADGTHSAPWVKFTFTMP